METKSFLKAWIAAGNTYNAQQYLDFYLPNAILNDPSVGRKFTGHTGILDYFNSYFIGYQTQTTIDKIVVQDETHAHMEVTFTGAFPEGKLGGLFDITFRQGKIAFVQADLIHT